MKNSQRAVVTLLGAAALLLLGSVLFLRFAVPQMPRLSGERTTRTYDHVGFDGVSARGQWDVTIERGDAWRVTVDVPVEVVEGLSVAPDGDLLELDLEFDGPRQLGDFRRDDSSPKATITMPALESLVLAGTTTLSFSGFDGSLLSLTSSGATQVVGNGRFDRLTLEATGAGDVDFTDMPVTNAEITVSGAGNVGLRMAGGTLTGRMSGAANLEYFGTVSEQNVSTSGVVSIRKVD
jgi:hypothetical protein